MAITVGPRAYRSVQIVDPLTGEAVTVTGGALSTSGGGGGGTVTLGAGTAIAGKFGIDQTTPGTTNGVQVNAALPAGTNVIGKVSIDQTTPGTTNAVQTLSGSVAQIVPATSGGTTSYHANVPNNVTGVVVKNTPGQVYGIQVSNNSTTVGYLHLYDSTSAPTAGAGTIKKTLIVPAPAAGGGGGNNYVNLLGSAFAAGIAYTFTAGNGTDADVTVPAVSTYSIEIDYK